MAERTTSGINSNQNFIFMATSLFKVLEHYFVVHKQKNVEPFLPGMCHTHFETAGLLLKFRK